MIPPDFTALLPGLTAVALALLVIYRGGARLGRVADAVEQGLVRDALQNYRGYALALLYAGAASLHTLGEVAEKLGWTVTGALAKVVQPGLVAIIACVNRNPINQPAAPRP